MKKIVFLFSGFAIAAFIITLMGSLKKYEPYVDKGSKNEKGFVLMELFTSQGCSSCPPADELIGKYALKNDEHIFPLAFHVDYWNRLGWTDSFSNKIFTERQQDYAAKFQLGSVYTPQLIVNGQKELVGSDELKVAGIVKDLLMQTQSVKINAITPVFNANKVSIGYRVINIDPNTSINAALVEASAITNIKRGENRGLKLINYNIVRDFKTSILSAASGSFTLNLPKGKNENGFSIVLYIQENSTGKITGAVKTVL